jgi:hypothetical protein
MWLLDDTGFSKERLNIAVYSTEDVTLRAAGLEH